MAGFGEGLGQSLPEAKCPVTDGKDCGTHPTAQAVAQQVAPGVGRFAVAVGHGDQLFGAVHAYAHQHEHA